MTNYVTNIEFYEGHRKRHEDAQTKLLEDYTEYQIDALKQKTKFKRCFFAVSIVLLFLPPLFLFTIYRAIYYGYISPDSYTALASLSGGLIALVADMLVIPKTVAEYCFNKDEDTNILKLFDTVEQHDRHGIKSENNKSN